MNVYIDANCGYTESFRSYELRGFSTHARQRQQDFFVRRHGAAKIVDNGLRRPYEGLSLIPIECCWIQGRGERFRIRSRKAFHIGEDFEYAL